MRIFVDMDGVLAKWGSIEYEEKLYEKGYFRNLVPDQNIVSHVQALIDRGYDVYVLSKFLEDSRYALNEKKEWIKQYMNIDEKNQIWVRYSCNKSDFIPGGIKKDDYLIDDYSPNLFEFTESGGRAIKYLNGINHTKGTWKGMLIDHRDTHLSDTIIRRIRDDLFKVKVISKGQKSYISYDICDIETDQNYKGYIQIGPDLRHLKTDSKDSIREVLFSDNCRMLRTKKNIMELSYVLRNVIRDIMSDSDPDRQLYVIDKNMMTGIVHKEMFNQSVIDEDVYYDAFRKDMAFFQDLGFVQSSGNDTYTIDTSIITVPDFSRADEYLHKAYKYNVYYQLNKDKDYREIACEYLMPVEYSRQRQKNMEQNREK